jgi:hypothetical protein
MAFFGNKKQQSKTSTALAQIVTELMTLCTAQQLEIQELKAKFAALASQVILRQQPIPARIDTKAINAQNEEKQRLQAVLQMDSMKQKILELKAKVVLLESQTHDLAEIRDEQMRLSKEHVLQNEQREEMFNLEILKVDVTAQLMLELEQSRNQL